MGWHWPVNYIIDQHCLFCLGRKCLWCLYRFADLLWICVFILCTCTIISSASLSLHSSLWQQLFIDANCFWSGCIPFKGYITSSRQCNLCFSCPLITQAFLLFSMNRVIPGGVAHQVCDQFLQVLLFSRGSIGSWVGMENFYWPLPFDWTINRNNLNSLHVHTEPVQKFRTDLKNSTTFSMKTVKLWQKFDTSRIHNQDRGIN